MKLTRVTYLVGALLVGASALATGTNILIGQAADQAMSQALGEAVRIQGMTQQITDAVSDIKVDIIQVQQFLTDISATRGLDGLDDGPSQAATFAQRLPDDLARAKALATALDDADMAATLDRIGADFGPYYAVGQKMADAYVAGGPEAGNTLMGEFDTVAATLATSVDEMVGHIGAITTKVGNDLRQREADLAGQQVLRSWIDVISHVIGIVGILALLLFTAEKFRRLRRVADVATRIAAGDLDAPRLGQSKWEELSAVFKAIGVFRDQGAELQAFQRETARQLEVAADSNGQIEAIGKSQAVIAFTPDGTILSANQNFLDTVGYGLKDIVGQKHRMFVAAEYAGSDDYRAFWDGLADGRFTSGEVRRVGKGGREIWLQATYNPIFDPQGRVTKVVKYASDITRKKITINQLSEGLHQLAQGNLGCRLDTAFDADFEPVRAAFNDTVARLNDIVGALRSTSASLKDTTADIMAGANTLSDRTTKQAAAIEETSATMEQLAATVADNARRAERASQRTTAAASEAREVGAVMQQSTEAMSHISSSSDKISSIIGVIDDIAFQTNLLALNASVEAARAGDAGKGFAVVAVEVRRLAQSAATASADIKGLIEASAQEVRTGNALVTKAYDQLAQMLTGLTECAGLVSAIASANQEQSGAIAEVSTAVREMDEVTQQNASLVETTHAAIERTEAEAAALDSIVDVFHVAAPANDRVTTSRKRA